MDLWAGFFEYVLESISSEDTAYYHCSKEINQIWPYDLIRELSQTEQQNLI